MPITTNEPESTRPRMSTLHYTTNFPLQDGANRLNPALLLSCPVLIFKLKKNVMEDMLKKSFPGAKSRIQGVESRNNRLLQNPG